LKKKKIKQDSFVTYSLKASEFAKHHFNQLAIGAAAIALIGAFFLFTSHARKRASLEAEQKLGSALQLYNQNDIEGAKKAFTDISDHYSRANAGLVAMYFKGECNLKLSNYSEALSSFEAYIRKYKKSPFFKEAAIIGKSLALEGAGNYLGAAVLLDNLLKEMDEKDPRYLDTAYRSAIFYSRYTEHQNEAVKYFKLVADKATGRMKNQAEVAVLVLKGTSD